MIFIKFQLFTLSPCLVLLKVGAQQVLYVSDFETGLSLANTTIYERNLNVIVTSILWGKQP